MNQLIADLLLLSRLEQEANVEDWTICCLNDLVNDLTEEFLELATASEIALAASLPTEVIHVMGNETQLYRLGANLIANALQYTPQGGTVIITLSSQERYAVLTVQDTGIGIAPMLQTQIFDRFYRVDGGRSRQSGGTGLGLAIAQAIAIKHKGKIQVQSEVHQGSCFQVNIPRHS